ncbi:MAG: S9 family peptidase [Rikenellaceae bacterium]|nr:S9 family peptidase [Rikenellaceae bacterium]
MKKLILFMALIAFAATSCQNEGKPTPLEIDNALTAAEIEAGILSPEVMWKMGRVGSSSLSPDGTEVAYTVTYYNMAENRGVTSIYLQPIEGGEPRQLTDNAGNDVSPQWAADGRSLYFLSNRSGSMQIWNVTTADAMLRQVSNIEGDIEAFGIAPTADKVYYIQPVHVKDILSKDVYKDMDKSKARIYDDLMARHWSYWDEGDYRHIFVADFDAAKGISNPVDIIGSEAAWDTPLAPYFDAAEIAWNNAGTALAYTCKPLTGTEYAVSTDSDVYVYDLASGKSLNICKGYFVGEEPAEDPRLRIMPTMAGYDKYPVWSPDDSQIAIRSMRRPGNESDKDRLLVYNCAEKSFKDVTERFDYNASNVVWEGNESIYFIAPIEATHQVCRVAVATGEVEVLTEGDHDINAFTKAGEKIVAEITTISSATELYTIDAEGAIAQLSNVNKPIYDNITMGRVEKRWVKTTDNKQMLVWVILPPNFDPAQKYPTLLYCQGGPQSVVSQFWSYRWNFQLMAAQGYVVVAPNRRGLPSFGQEWLDQISGDYSGQNIRDYLSAIDDVAREPWCDRERMGCVGASYGGYSTFFLAGNHEKRFKAFIAHCGIYNFESMYGETEELWFVNNDYGGSYWDKSNATAVRSYANSPHKFIDRWDSPILIFTGEYDFRIPYTQSLQAFTAARVRGLDSRLVVFENEGHQVFQPQNSLTWNREFFSWLDKYVKNPAE